LRQTPIKVSMIVFRDAEQYKEEDLYDKFTVVLNKPSNRGLGLSIVGKRNDVGVFISDVVCQLIFCRVFVYQKYFLYKL